jgi:hypothetical protein
LGRRYVIGRTNEAGVIAGSAAKAIGVMSKDDPPSFSL